MNTSALHLPTVRSAEHRSLGRRVRRVALALFFTSVVVNATLGIVAVVTPGFGETQSKILATSFFVTGAVLVALACEPAWERGLLGPVPYAGATLGAAGFTLAVVGMWGEIDSDVYGKVMGTLFIAAAACTAAGLLALARLEHRHRWVYVTALVLLAMGATMLAVLPWLGDDPPSMVVRATGVLLIGFAAFAVTVPVLHWIDRGGEDVAARPVRFCPYCSGLIVVADQAVRTCGQCGAVFTVTPRGARHGRSG